MKQVTTLNQRKMLRYVLQGVAFSALATVLVLVFTTGDDIFAQLRKFSPAYLPVLFAMVATAWVCNGARVWVMCRAAGHPLRYRQAIAVSLSTEFGIASTPAGVGGTVIRLTLLRQAGIPLTTAGSLLATDATVDVVFFSLLAPFAVYVLLHDGLLRALFDEPSELDTLLFLLGIVALVSLAVFLLRSEGFHRMLARLANATAFGRRHRLAVRHRHARLTVRRSVRRILTTLAFLWRQRKGALLLNLSLASVQWCCRYMMLPVIIYSLGAYVNPLPLFLVQGVLFALSLIVVVPGGGGSVEVLSAVILPKIVPGGMEAVALVVLAWRFFTYYIYILAGGSMFFYVCQRMHRLFPHAKEATPELVRPPSAPPGNPR